MPKDNKHRQLSPNVVRESLSAFRWITRGDQTTAFSGVAREVSLMSLSKSYFQELTYHVLSLSKVRRQVAMTWICWAHCHHQSNFLNPVRALYIFPKVYFKMMQNLIFSALCNLFIPGGLKNGIFFWE